MIAMAEGKIRKVTFDAIEIVAAGFPVASSLAVLSDKLRSTAVTDRLNARMDDLARAVLEIADPARMAELYEDPAFYAAFEKAASAARLSESDERLIWLQNGLINGYVLATLEDDREMFMDLIRRYSPSHVALLQRHAGPRVWPPSEREERQAMTEAQKRAYDDRVGSLRQTLVSDGLLTQSTRVEISETQGRRDEEPDVYMDYDLNNLGEAFLKFIADPDAPADPSAAPESPKEAS